MADEFKSEVIRFLREKKDGKFDEITYLGSEQRFVGPLINSGVNNLEEQFLIGTSTFTERYKDSEGNLIVETSYVDEDTTNGYYKLISVIRDENYIDTANNVYFDGHSLVILTDGSLAGFENVSLSLRDITIFSFGDNNELVIKPIETDANGPVAIQQDSLVFVKNDGYIPVIRKVTFKQTVVKNDMNVTQYREVITNELNS